MFRRSRVDHSYNDLISQLVYLYLQSDCFADLISGEVSQRGRYFAFTYKVLASN